MERMGHPLCDFAPNAMSQQLVAAGSLGQEAAEKAVALPLRHLSSIGYFHRECGHDIFVPAGGGKVDWLVDIVGGRVISLSQPLLLFGCFGRTLGCSDRH